MTESIPIKRQSGRSRMAAKRPTPEVLADPEGSNEASLVALLATLRLDAAGAVRAELALTLARKLDEGAGLAVAAVGREYRACVESLLMWTQAKEPTKLEELQARAAERRRMSGEERQRRADDLG